MTSGLHRPAKKVGCSATFNISFFRGSLAIGLTGDYIMNQKMSVKEIPTKYLQSALEWFITTTNKARKKLHIVLAKRIKNQYCFGTKVRIEPLTSVEQIGSDLFIGRKVDL